MYQFHLETNTQRKLVGEMEWKTQGLREKRRQRGWRRNGVGMRGVFFMIGGCLREGVGAGEEVRGQLIHACGVPRAIVGVPIATLLYSALGIINNLLA